MGYIFCQTIVTLLLLISDFPPSSLQTILITTAVTTNNGFTIFNLSSSKTVSGVTPPTTLSHGPLQISSVFLNHSSYNGPQSVRLSTKPSTPWLTSDVIHDTALIASSRKRASPRTTDIITTTNSSNQQITTSVTTSLKASISNIINHSNSIPTPKITSFVLTTRSENINVPTANMKSTYKTQLTTTISENTNIKPSPSSTLIIQSSNSSNVTKSATFPISSALETYSLFPSNKSSLKTFSSSDHQSSTSKILNTVSTTYSIISSNPASMSSYDMQLFSTSVSANANVNVTTTRRISTTINYMSAPFSAVSSSSIRTETNAFSTYKAISTYPIKLSTSTNAAIGSTNPSSTAQLTTHLTASSSSMFPLANPSLSSSMLSLPTHLQSGNLYTISAITNAISASALQMTSETSISPTTSIASVYTSMPLPSTGKMSRRTSTVDINTNPSSTTQITTYLADSSSSMHIFPSANPSLSSAAHLQSGNLYTTSEVTNAISASALPVTSETSISATNGIASVYTSMPLPSTGKMSRRTSTIDINSNPSSLTQITTYLTDSPSSMHIFPSAKPSLSSSMLSSAAHLQSGKLYITSTVKNTISASASAMSPNTSISATNGITSFYTTIPLPSTGGMSTIEEGTPSTNFKVTSSSKIESMLTSTVNRISTSAPTVVITTTSHSLYNRITVSTLYPRSTSFTTIGKESSSRPLTSTSTVIKSANESGITEALTFSRSPVTLVSNSIQASVMSSKTSSFVSVSLIMPSSSPNNSGTSSHTDATTTIYQSSIDFQETSKPVTSKVKADATTSKLFSSSNGYSGVSAETTSNVQAISSPTVTQTLAEYSTHGLSPSISTTMKSSMSKETSRNIATTVLIKTSSPLAASSKVLSNSQSIITTTHLETVSSEETAHSVRSTKIENSVSITPTSSPLPASSRLLSKSQIIITTTHAETVSSEETVGYTRSNKIEKGVSTTPTPSPLPASSSLLSNSQIIITTHAETVSSEETVRSTRSTKIEKSVSITPTPSPLPASSRLPSKSQSIITTTHLEKASSEETVRSTRSAKIDYGVTTMPTSSFKTLQTSSIFLPLPSVVRNDYKMQMILRVAKEIDIFSVGFKYSLKTSLEVLYEKGKSLKRRKKRAITNSEIFIISTERIQNVENIQALFYLQENGSLVLAQNASSTFRKVSLEEMDDELGYIVVSRPSPLPLITTKDENSLQIWVIVVAVLVPVIVILICLNAVYCYRNRTKHLLKLSPANEEAPSAWASKNYDLFKASNNNNSRHNIESLMHYGVYKEHGGDNNDMVEGVDGGKLSPILSRNSSHLKKTEKKHHHIEFMFEEKEEKEITHLVRKADLSGGGGRNYKSNSSPGEMKKDHCHVDNRNSSAGAVLNLTKGAKKFQANPLKNNIGVRLHKDVLSPPTSLQDLHIHSNEKSHQESSSARLSNFGQHSPPGVCIDTLDLSSPTTTTTATPPSFGGDSSNNSNNETHRLLEKLSTLQVAVDSLKNEKEGNGTGKKSDSSITKRSSTLQSDHDNKSDELEKKVEIENIRNKDRIRKREKAKAERRLKRNEVIQMTELFSPFDESMDKDEDISSQSYQRKKEAVKKLLKKKKSKRIAPTTSPLSTESEGSARSICSSDGYDEELSGKLLKDGKGNRRRSAKNEDTGHQQPCEPTGDIPYHGPVYAFQGRLPPMHLFTSPYNQNGTALVKPIIPAYHDPSIQEIPRNAFMRPTAWQQYPIALPTASVNISSETDDTPKSNLDSGSRNGGLILPNGRCQPRKNIRNVTQVELESLEKAQANAREKLKDVLFKASDVI